MHPHHALYPCPCKYLASYPRTHIPVLGVLRRVHVHKGGGVAALRRRLAAGAQLREAGQRADLQAGGGEGDGAGGGARWDRGRLGKLARLDGMEVEELREYWRSGMNTAGEDGGIQRDGEGDTRSERGLENQRDARDVGRIERTCVREPPAYG